MNSGTVSKERVKTKEVATSGQIRDIITALIQAMPSDMPKDAAQWLIGQKWLLSQELPRVFDKIFQCVEFFAESRRFYKEVFDAEIDSSRFSDLILSPPPAESMWFIAIPREFRLEYVCHRGFLRYKNVYYRSVFGSEAKRGFGAFDDVFSVRDAHQHSYAIWLQKDPAGDKEKNIIRPILSFDYAKEEITLLERIVLGAWLLWKTGEPLEEVTLCNGSRDLHYIPVVRETKHLMELDFCEPDEVTSSMCRRIVIA